MTDPEGIITFINPEFTRLYGYGEEEIVGKVTPRILKGGNMQPEEYLVFWKTILDKRVARGEMLNRTKEGRLVSVEVSVNPILDEHGDITGFLAIQRDVTRRKQLEEQFRQAQKMEAVGRLAGGVAHDFNNILTVINGYSEVMLDQLKPENTHHKYASEIKKAGERAAGLTRQLLAFSRQQVLEPQVLDLNHVIANVHAMLKRLIGEDIDLVTVPRPDLGRVKADPGQIEQILLNLAVNARDAMPRGGKLSIETGNVDLDDSYTSGDFVVKPGPYVMLAATDSGTGMDAETQKRIFEPFFTTKEKGKGTGLGLSTVYGIVKQSEGYITVYSEMGHGTTFKIYLPRVDASAEVVRPVTTEVAGAHPHETVLLVEDDTPIRRLIFDTLKSRGYNVLQAQNGDEAIQLAGRYLDPIQLMLTDLVMPGMSGRVLAERMVALHPESRVLYMSGYTDDAVIRHGGLGAGAAFLQKPFTPDAVANKVRQVLDAA
jgi:PAS domain S-box-containing protein